MTSSNLIEIGVTEKNEPVSLYSAMANRHGLIAGATGTGKTVTLQKLAEGFSRIGIPVFTADIKGDLSGLGQAAEVSEKLQKRINQLGIANYQPAPNPVVFWDIYGAHGHSLRTTISEVGPLMLGRILELEEVQAEVLQLAFKIADDQGLLLLDCKDLHEFLLWLGENAKDLKDQYGHIAPATLGVIQRAVLNLTQRGGDKFFGEPALRLEHLMQHDLSGRGLISILDASTLLHDPLLYSTFLLWLLSELFEELPETGDTEKPKLVFFFDEAHLLFRNANRSLITKIEQVVRLIRSKGVGIYFVTQNPSDIPDGVLAQLGNSIQHALRAYTPKEEKAVKTAAQSFRPNPNFSTERAITELELGKALVSVLDEQGKPTVVQKTLIIPPQSKMGVLESNQRLALIKRSPFSGLYEQTIDRESAFEQLRQRRKPQEKAKEEQDSAKTTTATREKTRRSERQTVAEAMIKSVVRSLGSSLGRQLARGILGSFRR